MVILYGQADLKTKINNIPSRFVFQGDNMNFKSIKNKKIIIGITYIGDDKDKKVQFQIWGTVIKADRNDGIIVCIENIDLLKNVLLGIPIELYGGNLKLPPDLSSISYAQKGEYHLKYTDEVVLNPDLLSTWTIEK